MRRWAHVWIVDAEYFAPPGHRPIAHCLVAHDIVTGETIAIGSAERCARATGQLGFQSSAKTSSS